MLGQERLQPREQEERVGRPVEGAVAGALVVVVLPEAGLDIDRVEPYVAAGELRERHHVLKEVLGRVEAAMLAQQLWAGEGAGQVEGRTTPEPGEEQVGGRHATAIVGVAG